MPHWIFFAADPRTNEGRLKFATSIISIGEKLFSNGLLIIFGSAAADAANVVNNAKFWWLYGIGAASFLAGFSLLIVGSNQYDHAHRKQ